MKYGSQDEAWQFLADTLGDSAELLDGLDASILPASREVARGRALDKDSLDERREAWRALSEVDDVPSNQFNGPERSRRTARVTVTLI